MDSRNLWRQFEKLPPPLQQEALDFIEFLQSRSTRREPEKLRPVSLREEPFIGMWKDRDEMADSAGWVESMRRKDWL